MPRKPLTASFAIEIFCSRSICSGLISPVNFVSVCCPIEKLAGDFPNWFPLILLIVKFLSVVLYAILLTSFWWSRRVSIPQSGKGTLAFLPDETFHSPVFVFAILYKVTSSSFSGDIPDFFLLFLIFSIFHLLLHHVISCDSGIFPPFSDLFLQIFQKTGGCTMPGPHTSICGTW